MAPMSITRSSLGCGFVAGPFYLALGVAQGLLRDGFSFARHPLSALANGAGGWVQTANFALSALLVLAAVAGMSRAAPQHSRGMRAALVVYALGMIAAAIFPTDRARCRLARRGDKIACIKSRSRSAGRRSVIRSAFRHQ
jgi:hypothetical protein